MNCLEARTHSVTIVLIFVICYIVAGSHASMVRRAAYYGSYYDDYGSPEESEPEEVIVYSHGEIFTPSLGQTVELPCEISADNVVVEWLKDKTSYTLSGIKTTNAPDSVTLANNNLIIHNIELRDAGTYECLIFSDPVQSVVHTIRLKMFPEITSIESSVGQIVIEGMNLTLTCNVTGFPQPTLIWVKETSNKENIKLTPDKAQFGANSVTIQNLTMADSGTYICYATNDIGKGSAKKINIKVLGKPHVRVQRPVINSAPNIEAVLECMVQEEPLADIHWYKDGELLNITKFKIETIEQNSTLRVTPQTEDEFGVFTCKAENPYGTHERSIKLVQYPVIDTLKPVNGTTFRWTITSHLPLEQIELNIKERSEKNWGNVSIPVPEVTNHSYDVEYVMSTDSYRPGNYSATIRAKNSAEWRESEDAQEIELVLPDGAARPATTALTALCLFLLTRIL